MYTIDIYEDYANDILRATIENPLSFEIEVRGDQIMLDYLQPCAGGFVPMFTMREFIIKKDGKVCFQNLHNKP